MTDPIPRPLYRRTLLAALCAGLAGCGGYAADDSGEDERLPTTRGNDDAPIRATVEELLPTVDVLGDEWRRDGDDENCRDFLRFRDGGSTLLTACAFVYEDVAAAETGYEDRVERLHKLSDRGSPTDEAPDVGVEATRIEGWSDSSVVFRDANAVGSVQLDSQAGPGDNGEIDPDNAVRFAAAMHDRWRD